MKYLSLFSGIGAFELALKRLGIEYELVGFSEIDKYAIKSYCAVHGVSEELNLGDISKIDLDSLPEDIDLITHGSPCQDFSVAGLQAGGDKGTGTRSSLMWCTVDIVEKVKPKYVIWENVKNLLSKSHKHNFDSYIEVMDKLGYNSYYQVLNAKDYGIPQNRERVFTISIRKDIDAGFNFPEKQELKLRLKDLLDEKVDEKYYLSESSVKNLQRSFGSKAKEVEPDGICDTLQAAMGCGGGNVPVLNVIGKLDIKGHDCVKRVYDADGISPTLTDMQGGNRQPKIVEPVIAASRGRNPENPSDRTPGIHTEQRLEINSQGVSNTITSVQKDNYVIEPSLKIKGATKREVVVTDDEDLEEYDEFDLHAGEYADLGCGLKIRKLTPLECWRLMGFDDEDFYKAKAVPTSDTQLYKQAGNSIVVNVLEAIFKNLFGGKDGEK